MLIDTSPEQSEANENKLASWLLPGIGMSHPSLTAHHVQTGGMLRMKCGRGGVIGSVPPISLFKVSVIVSISRSSFCKLIEFTSSTCFAYIFIC